MSTEFEQQTQMVVNKLFLTFEGIWGSAFKIGYGTDDAYDNGKREWTKALIHANVCDIEKIKLAVNEVRELESPYMLSIGKFISIYKSIGLYDTKYPMLDTKRIEIQKSSNDTAAVYLNAIKDLLK